MGQIEAGWDNFLTCIRKKRILEEKKDMRANELNEIFVYQKSMELGEKIWGIVAEWDFFQRDTLGKQWVKSMDSVAANIAEGFGRYYYKENKLFCYYSRGSLQETVCWLKKAHSRNLVSDEQFTGLEKELQLLALSLNRYINAIGKNPGLQKKGT